MRYFNVFITIALGLGCGLAISQTDPAGAAVSYGRPFSELPENVRPNDATISLYQNRLATLIEMRRAQGRLYKIEPKGNAVPFKQSPSKTSQALEKELASGFIVSYLYYESGVIQFNGKAKDGRFNRNINDEMLFATHSTGKSINSYVVGHAICEGHISSIDEVIDWPMMSNTLYQGQPLRNLLNMNAGDKHTVDQNSSYVMATAGLHGQNMMIDMDNSRIVVTNSAATGWDQQLLLLNVIKNGELPK